MSFWFSSRSFWRDLSAISMVFGSGGGGPSGTNMASGSGSRIASSARLAAARGTMAPVSFATSMVNCARCIRCMSVAMFGSDTGTTSQSPSA
jgi:hypothetical protein